MALTPPIPGLRPLVYDARSPGKLSLSVTPGTRLDADEALAAQLIAADPHFHDVGADPVKGALAPVEDVEPEPDEAKPAKRKKG